VLDRPGDPLDGPTPWSSNVVAIGEPFLRAAETALGVDSRGTIWVAAIVFPMFNMASRIAVARSSDGGQSFAIARVFDPTSSVSWLGDPTVAIDHQDRVFVGWAEYRTVGSASAAIAGRVKVARSEDGTTWTEPTTIGQAGPEPWFEDRPWFSVSPDGAVYLVWFGAPAADGFASPGQYWSRALGGAPFDPPRAIYELSRFLSTSPLAFDGAGAPMAVGEDGREVRAWRLSAESWVSAPVGAIHPAPGLTDHYIQIASDPAGSLTVAYADGSFGAIVPFLSRSTDGGRHWSGVARLDRGLGPPSSAALPWITTDDRERVHLLWLDNRSGGWVPYTAVSDDGVAFREPERIGDASFVEDGSSQRWIGDFNALVVRGGRRYAAWTDTRSGTSRIYFSTAPEPQ
jgi:hypothetical protein